MEAVGPVIDRGYDFAPSTGPKRGLRRNGSEVAALAALVAALWLVALGALASPALAKRKPAQAAVSTGQLRGVNLTPNRAFAVNPYAFSDADNRREINSACQLGSTVVRLFVNQADLEPSPGAVNQTYASTLDSLMTNADSCGLKVIMSFAGTPLWDTTAPAGERQYGKYPALDGATQYQWMTAWMMRRWPGLYAIEVGNEPNLKSFWMGTPSQYVDLVNAAIASKRQTGSRTQIIAGVLAVEGATDYLRQLYAAGLRGEDGLSLHPYSSLCIPYCQPWSDPARKTSPFRSSIEGVHRLMLQNGDPAKMWLTEFGFSSCPSAPVCVSDDVQAAWDSESVQVAACYPYVAGLTAFTLRDISVPSSWDPTSWHWHFGLMGTDFSPKPSFGAVSAAYHQLTQVDAQSARAASVGHPKAKKARRRATVPYASSAKCRKLLGYKPRKRR